MYQDPFSIFRLQQCQKVNSLINPSLRFIEQRLHELLWLHLAKRYWNSHCVSQSVLQSVCGGSVRNLWTTRLNQTRHCKMAKVSNVMLVCSILIYCKYGLAFWALIYYYLLLYPKYIIITSIIFLSKLLQLYESCLHYLLSCCIFQIFVFSAASLSTMHIWVNNSWAFWFLHRIRIG